MRLPTLPRPTPSTTAVLLASFVLGLASASGVRAQSAGPAIESLRVGFADSAPGRYKLGTWTPVLARLRAGEAPFEGFLEIVAPDDDGIPTALRTPIELSGSDPRDVWALTRVGPTDAEVTGRLLDAEGRPVPGTSARVALQPESLGQSVTLVLASGAPSGLETLPDLPRYRPAGSVQRDLVIAPFREWPAVPFGLDAVEAIVLETSDRAVRDRLKAGEAEQFRAWVAGGGHLVVALGEGWQEVSEAFGDLLPARPFAPTGRAGVLEDLGALESFADKPFRVPGASPPRIVPVEGWAERGGVPIASTAATPLVVRRAYGLGRVTLTGLDVSGGPFADWPDREFFWDKVLDLRRSGAEAGINAYATTGGGGAILQAAAPELGARLHRALEVFPGVRIVPFGWVAAFVLGYIVLIGPLDYLFLRKVVKRMQWTWLTFPLIVAAVSLSAFAVAYALKGDGLRVNKIDLIDYDQAGGTYRGRSWLTLYSPSNHDYDLALNPLGPDLKPAPDEDEQALSWFGSPDPVSRNMGRITLGQAAYRYEPAAVPEGLEGVRVAVWSTKAFVGRWSGTSEAEVLSADLHTTSGDRLSGTVRNRLDRPLVGVRLFYGRNVYDLGRIAPGGLARVDPSRSEATARYLSRLVADLDEPPDGASPDDGAATRAGVLRTAMFHDALANRAAEAPSLGLRELDLSALAADLRRPMLVAELDAPAAELVLDDPPAAPTVEQTTLIRVLLPLGAAEGRPGSWPSPSGSDGVEPAASQDRTVPAPAP